MSKKTVKKKHVQALGRRDKEDIVSSGEEAAKNLKEHLPVAGCSTHVSDREQSCASSIGPVTSTPIGPVAEVLDSVLSPIKRE